MYNKSYINKKKCYEFICDFRSSKMNFLNFLELVVEWNILKEEEKEKTIKIIKTQDDFKKIDNGFGRILNFRKYNNEYFNLDKFYEFYNKWKNFNTNERKIIYGNILTNKQYKYDRTERSEYIKKILIPEKFDKDIDIRNWDKKWAQKDKISSFRCRQCAEEFLCVPYELQCPNCGSPNIYMRRTLY